MAHTSTDRAFERLSVQNRTRCRARKGWGATRENKCMFAITRSKTTRDVKGHPEHCTLLWTESSAIGLVWSLCWIHRYKNKISVVESKHVQAGS